MSDVAPGRIETLKAISAWLDMLQAKHAVAAPQISKARLAVQECDRRLRGEASAMSDDDLLRALRLAYRLVRDCWATGVLLGDRGFDWLRTIDGVELKDRLKAAGGYRAGAIPVDRKRAGEMRSICGA